MTTVLDGPHGLHAAVGTSLGVSEWMEVTADRVARYREASGDIDAPDAVPPFQVLAFSNLFLPEVVRVDGFAMGVNYGVDAVRFPAPVPIGSRIRASVELIEVTTVGAGLQTLMRITIETEGSQRPGCVIDSLSRWFP